MKIEVKKIQFVATTSEVAGDVPPWREVKAQCK